MLYTQTWETSGVWSVSDATFCVKGGKTRIIFMFVQCSERNSRG